MKQEITVQEFYKNYSEYHKNYDVFWKHIDKNGVTHGEYLVLDIKNVSIIDYIVKLKDRPAVRWKSLYVEKKK